MKWAKSHPVIALVLILWCGLMLAGTLSTEDPDVSPIGIFLFALALGGIVAWMLTLLSNATVGRSKKRRARVDTPTAGNEFKSPEIQLAKNEEFKPVVSPFQSATENQIAAVHPPQQRTTEPIETPSAYQSTSHKTLPPKVEQKRGGNITLKEIINYTPMEFEEFCAKALNSMGYQDMKRTGGAGDLQADIIGKDTHGRSTIVQCKRYKPGSKIGSPVIQSFIGMKSVHHRADRGIFVTTADYSRPAIRLAQQHDIVLIDGDDLVKLAGLVFVPRVEARPKYQVRYCSNCGSEIEGHEVRFCAECGSPIQR